MTVKERWPNIAYMWLHRQPISTVFLFAPFPIESSIKLARIILAHLCKYGLMRAVMDIADTLKRLSEMPLERFRIVRHIDELKLSSISRGIIFIFAVWSGPAHMAFKSFTRALSRIDVSSLELVVLDTDHLPYETATALWGRNVNGAGETIWIRDGTPVSRLMAFDPKCEAELVKYTIELIKGPPP